MPKYQKPNSDLARQAFLETAAKTGQKDIDAGKDYVSQELVTAIVDFLPNYDLKVENVTMTL